MTAGGTRIVEGRAGKDSLRRVALVSLALYLTPALLVVLLIGGLGVACCAVLRLTGSTLQSLEIRSARFDGPVRAIGTPHIRETSRSRSPRC